MQTPLERENDDGGSGKPQPRNLQPSQLFAQNRYCQKHGDQGVKRCHSRDDGGVPMMLGTEGREERQAPDPRQDAIGGAVKDPFGALLERGAFGKQ